MINLAFRCFSVVSPLAKPSLASLVGKLRSETGQSFSLCRKALEAASMDLDRARTELYKLVQAQAQNTQMAGLTKEQKQGLVGVMELSNRQWGLIEMRCVSDFVSRNPIFIDLATKILQSAQNCTVEATTDMSKTLDKLGVNSDLLEAVGKLKEPITVSRLQIINRAPEEIIGTYVHQQVSSSFGAIASLVGISSLPREEPWAKSLAASLAKHVAGMNPSSVEELLNQDYLFQPEMKVGEYLAESSRNANHVDHLKITQLIRLAL